jgi:hypothetical protein
MALTPYPPMTERPLPDKFGAGMSWIQRWRDGKAEATWIHTMVGTLWGTDAYFRMANIYAATDYGIGGALDGADYDGRIFRWINYYERPNTAGWASGWGDDGPGIEGDGQALLDQFGGLAINGTGRSIENSGLVATPMTAKQWASMIHRDAAIHHREMGQGYEQFAWDMHHKEVAKKDCCFPRIYDHTVEYQAGVIAIMRHFETGENMPDTIQIAGLTVDLPWDAQEIPPEPPADKPVMIAFPKIIEFTTRQGAVSRQWAYTGADIVRKYPTGTTLRCVGYYHGQMVSGDDRWLVIKSRGISNGARIHSSGVREPIPDPGLPQ